MKETLESMKNREGWEGQMKTLYLHIGTPKTATTSLQHFCEENETIFKENNYCYPLFPRKFRHIQKQKMDARQHGDGERYHQLYRQCCRTAPTGKPWTACPHADDGERVERQQEEGGRKRIRKEKSASQGGAGAESENDRKIAAGWWVLILSENGCDQENMWKDTDKKQIYLRNKTYPVNISAFFVILHWRMTIQKREV